MLQMIVYEIIFAQFIVLSSKNASQLNADHLRTGYTDTLCCSSDLDLDPMTLMYEFDIMLLEIYLCIKN